MNRTMRKMTYVKSSLATASLRTCFTRAFFNANRKSFPYGLHRKFRISLILKLSIPIHFSFDHFVLGVPSFTLLVHKSFFVFIGVVEVIIQVRFAQE